MYFSHSQNEPPTPLQGIRFAQKEAMNAKGIKTGASTDFAADSRDFNVFENSARPQLQGQRSTLDDTLAKIAKEIAAFRLEEERKSKQSMLPLTNENTHRLFWNNYLKRNDPKKLGRAVKEREAQSPETPLPTWFSMWDSVLTSAAPSLPSATG